MFGVAKLLHFQIDEIHHPPACCSAIVLLSNGELKSLQLHFDYEISLLEHWKINKSLSENRVTKIPLDLSYLFHCFLQEDCNLGYAAWFILNTLC